MIKLFAEGLLRSGLELDLDSYGNRHLRVIRAVPGDRIIIGDASGKAYRADITSLNGGCYTVRLGDRIDTLKPVFRVDLFVALPKRDKMEDIIFKCTQLGVSEFIPVISSRTIKYINTRNRDRILDRWNKKARHGAELSHREKIPEIADPVSFDTALEIFSQRQYGSGFFFWEEYAISSLVHGNNLSDTAVFIGPEGGWSPEEACGAENSGLRIKSLGPFILDVETACVAACALILCG